MKKIILFAMSLMLASCANLLGSVSDGYYTSANKEFKVKTPAIPRLTAKDGVLNGRQFVDFYQSRGYWKEHGLFSIEWYEPKKEIKSDKAFYRHVKNAVPSLVKNNFGSRGTFSVVNTRRLKINESVAYQFIADGMLDTIDAVWAGTAIKFDNYVALVSVVIYSKNSINTELHGATVQSNIPWNKYNAFLRSFTKLKSE